MTDKENTFLKECLSLWQQKCISIDIFKKWAENGLITIKHWSDNSGTLRKFSTKIINEDLQSTKQILDIGSTFKMDDFIYDKDEKTYEPFKIYITPDPNTDIKSQSEIIKFIAITLKKNNDKTYYLHIASGSAFISWEQFHRQLIS